MPNDTIARILNRMRATPVEQRVSAILEAKKKKAIEGNKRRNKKWKEANPERVAELDRQKAKRSYHKNHEANKNRQRKWHKKFWDAMTPEERQCFKLRQSYGITLEDKNKMLEGQRGLCVICQTDDPGGRGWQLDHCHTEKTIRGILCLKCNTGLGLFKDNPELLRRAASYLEGNKEWEAPDGEVEE